VPAAYCNLGNIFKAIGERDAALDSYRKALALDPDHVDALYNMANLLQELGRYEEALVHYDSAIALAPRDADAWNNCAAVLERLDRLHDALQAVEHAIGIAPGHVNAHTNRGNILVPLGRIDEAIACYEQALALSPDHLEAHINLGSALQLTDEHVLALASFDTVLALDPKHAEAHHRRGKVLRELKRNDEALAALQHAIVLKPDAAQFRCTLGSLVQAMGNLQGALDCFDAALAIDDSNLAVHNDRGIVLQRLRRFDEALACFEMILERDPDHSEAALNRANVLQRLLRVDEALAAYDAIAARKGEDASIWNNRGNAYEELGRFEEAKACFDAAIALNPDYAIAHWNLSLLNLQYGHLGDGWRGYEWRWQNESLSCYREKREFLEPNWLGQESLEGKTILLFAEQGLGDSLQFCRYVPLVKARGARVVLEVQGPLTGLLAGLDGVDQILRRGDPLPPFDYQCSLMSLPLAFGTEVDTIPAPAHYLAADPERVAAWRERLGPQTRPRVGLAWSGNPLHNNDHNRSIALSHLAPLLALDCEFVSLQKEHREEDVAVLDAAGVRRMDAHIGDFADTAALCELMDVVVSVDTSIAHLAGAVGRPLWVLLPHVADWRWLTERSDSPWYPGARLFRQSKAGGWDSVIAEVQAALQALPRS